MPRTTIDLNQDLLEELKARAAREHLSLKALLNRIVRAGLNMPPTPPPTPLPVFGLGDAEVDVNDREALYRAMERSRKA